MLSLSEISLIEEADSLGAKSLGSALDALLRRWGSGLKDDETFIRMLFLKWYSLCEPNWYNGLPDKSELSLETLINEKGSVDSFSFEIQFIIGVLAHSFPWCFGDEAKWQNLSQKLLLSSGNSDSVVFKNWSYLLGVSSEVSGLRKNISPELHARFKGRGEMGRYLIHILSSNL